MHAGLAYERAPPLRVPLRFFLTAPVLGAAAAVVLLVAGPAALQDRWSPALLAATHLYTLGVLTMVMCGALFQMLPVVAGSPVPRPVLVAGVVHPALTVGTVALAAGLLRGSGASVIAGAVLLAGGLSLFLGAVVTCLSRVPRWHDPVRGMALAHAGLAVSLVLGVWLAAGHGPGDVVLRRVPLTDLHAAWGAIGWAAMLVVAVAYQVVPMFQLAPPYPARLRLLLAPGLAVVLLAWSAGAGVPAGAGLALLLAVFAGTTLWVQARRRRRRADATVDCWRLGLAMLLAAGVLWGVSVHTGSGAALVSAGMAFLAGFTLSVVVAMLYKIVPFLVWLHLQASDRPAPTVGRILPASRARWQLWVHGLGVGLLVAAPWSPEWLVRPAALLMLVSFVVLGVNLFGAARTRIDDTRGRKPKVPPA